MAISIPRGQSDETIEKIVGGLRTYEANHPKAKIDLYRQNPVSVRVRIVDPHFAGKSKSERSQEAWKYLDNVPDGAHSDREDTLQLGGIDLFHFDSRILFGPKDNERHEWKFWQASKMFHTG